MKDLFQSKIAILGPGLLGGSLALALRKELAGRAPVGLWGRREEVIREAQTLQIADQASTDLGAVVEDAGLVILCTPVEVMPGLAREIAPQLRPGTLITDVGSVKASVVRELVPIFEERGSHFVGSHPMAGSEQSGLGAARADLFTGATTILTPHPGLSPEALAATRKLWECLGCRVSELDPEAHDRTVGLVSHLPHFLAAALVDFVLSEGWSATDFCGNGFRDTTRIASGPAPMWSGIFAENREAVVDQLERFGANLAALTALLKSGDDTALTQFLQRAKDARDTLI